jgi:MFS family permease
VYELNSTVDGISVKRAWRQLAWSRVSANVWYLGFTSLLTDVSSEMITSILPIYLVLHLHMTPFAFGAIDGLYQGVAALVRTASGVVSDWLRRYKSIAAVGYLVSAASKLGFLLAGARWAPLAAVVTSDRLGKGIRTAPRDTLIALSTPSDRLATSFGVHRALDAAGAMLGPVVAFAILAFVPGEFDLVFLTSFCIALVGLAVLVLFVQSPHEGDASQRAGRVQNHGFQTDSNGASQGSQSEERKSVVDLMIRGPQFRPLLIAASALALTTVSDAFLYLVLQQSIGFDGRLVSLLYVGTPLVYFMLAAPFGILADHIGAGRMFVAGHLLLLVLYGVLIWAGFGQVAALICVVLLGGYYAATDGVLAALASARLPVGRLGTGLAALATATNLARAFASLAFGYLWTRWGRETALLLFSLGLCASMGVALRQLGASGESKA